MNPKRQFRRLRNDDRWIGLPNTTGSAAPAAADPRAGSRRSLVTTGIAFAVSGVVAVGLWAGLTSLHGTQPASPEPLPVSTDSAKTVEIPCTDSERLSPIGCSTYTAVAAAGVPGGTTTWSGATPPTLTLRLLDGKVTALVSTGCNELTIPMRLSDSELTRTSGIAMTAMLCEGARGAQEQWVRSLFGGPVTYTLDGTKLRLSAGKRVLQLTATPSAAPSRAPTPRPTELPSRNTPVTTTKGCAPTSATMPAGAFSAPIEDVDGDGRRDTEWAALTPDLQFGITTASGATISGSQAFAGGGQRSFVVGRLANGVVVAITSEGRDSPVYTFSGCRFHPLLGKDLLPDTSASSQFAFYTPEFSGEGGCFDGRLAFTHLAPMPGSRNGSDEEAIARWVDVSADGLRATLTNDTSTIAEHLNFDKDPSASSPYDGISCGASKVLHPIYHGG